MYKLIAKACLLWARRAECKIGYKLKFSFIPNTWINSLMIYSMARAWAKHGINAEGVNYFTVGSLVNGLSSRFIRNEKQYQSWLGAYLVKFKDDKNFTLQDHLNLAIADQKNWLADYGDKQPFVEMPQENAKQIGPFALGSYQGKLYEFSACPSHSDVGKYARNWKTIWMLPIMAGVMNLLNPALRLTASNFLPKDLTANYEMVILKGYVAIVEIEKNIKLVLYGNGAVIKNSGGQTVDHSLILKEDILSAFRSASIEKF